MEDSVKLIELFDTKIQDFNKKVNKSAQASTKSSDPKANSTETIA